VTSFSDQIKKCKEKVDRIVTETHRATALAVYGELIQSTPVDTGRAKSNWWMDINRVSLEIREPDNGDAGQAQAESVSGKDTKPDDVIYISNNLPYINRLDDGYSDQAPAGFVAAAVQVGVSKVKEIARRVK
jgi:hypothetical protein